MHYEVDEKAQNVVLTDQGVKDCEKVRFSFNLVCLLARFLVVCWEMTSHQPHPPTTTNTTHHDITQVLGKSLFDLADPWMSFVTNGLKAKELLLPNKDYIVRGACIPSRTTHPPAHPLTTNNTYPTLTKQKGNDIAIVDRFSGRVLEGRKYSDGLQQSIQTKEGLPCSSQSQVIATITYQSLFRLFYKLSGMTGTALTDFKVRK